MTAQFFFMQIPEITVEELEKLLQTDSITQLQLIDVREPQEVLTANIEGFLNYPLSQYSEWSDQILVELDPAKETLVLCHHGVRSAHMCQWLMRQGFINVKNINGGIDAYSIYANPQVPRY